MVFRRGRWGILYGGERRGGGGGLVPGLFGLGGYLMRGGFTSLGKSCPFYIYIYVPIRKMVHFNYPREEELR